jgi:hypothetical protein
MIIILIANSIKKKKDPYIQNGLVSSWDVEELE